MPQFSLVLYSLGWTLLRKHLGGHFYATDTDTGTDTDTDTDTDADTDTDTEP